LAAVSVLLQQILEGAGLPFTGMTSDFAFKCSNRLTLNLVRCVGEFGPFEQAAADATPWRKMAASAWCIDCGVLIVQCISCVLIH
jgi:hypothetical protein